jgi:hypothetical protein
MDARGVIKLAGEIKKRDNEKKIGNVIGTVVSINPLKVSVLGGQGIFEGNDISISSSLVGYDEEVTITIDGTTHNGTIHHTGLQIGDKVHVAFTENNQKIFATSKI